MADKPTVASPKNGTIELRAECKNCGSIVWTTIKCTNPLITDKWLHEGNQEEVCVS